MTLPPHLRKEVHCRLSLETRVDRLEKNLETTAKLVKLGMKILLKTQQLGKENREAINALIEAQMRAEARIGRAEARMDHADARMNRADAREEARQRRIDERLNRLIDVLLRRSPNGRNGRQR